MLDKSAICRTIAPSVLQEMRPARGIDVRADDERPPWMLIADAGGRGGAMGGLLGPTGHVDTFARDNLPPVADWPVFDSPLMYPAELNCAAELLDANVAGAGGDRPALHFEGGRSRTGNSSPRRTGSRMCSSKTSE